ncbi:MAG: hypothetical protein JWQ21_2993 [Herminiimonas sp.]|nr:hypothetical protein [Herminiimonas sp.]
MMMNFDNGRLRPAIFWLAIAALVLFKFILMSGEAVQMVYSPHDDGLYVSRAFHLLLDGNFGPYDARLLVKLPGFSLWLAGTRLLGIPYLLSINILYVLAGLYFVAALRRCNFNRLLLLAVFALYLFNPVTMDHQWFRVMREPLAICLLVIVFAAMIYILADIRERRLPIFHIIAFSGAFAFALLVREEDQLLYGLFGMFAAVFIGQMFVSWDLTSRRARALVVLAIGLPLIFAFSGNRMTLSFVEKHYGARIMYDFGEGEFPKLIAAIRSVQSQKDNRHVMITQEALGRLRTAAPSLAPVIEGLPTPSPHSYSCQRFQVCSEWTNGWELFWIKDAAFQSGLTPTLPAAQAYFRKARLEIEKACAEKILTCRDKGHGLLPPMELRWTRAYLNEAKEILKMMGAPGIDLAGPVPATYPVSLEYGHMYQAVTMSHHFDSLLQSANQDEAWKAYPKDLYLSLKYWERYPDIAANKDFGPQAGGNPLGAVTHYQRHGKAEGRIWEDKKSAADSAIQYASPARKWQERILDFYRKYGSALELIALVALVLRLVLWRTVPPGPFALVALMFAGFTIMRMMALSYVSVYMGGLDVRLFFSTYIIGLLLSPLIIADTARIIFAERHTFLKYR